MLFRFALVGVALLSVAAGGSAPATLVHETVWLRSGEPVSGLVVTEQVPGYCTAPARATTRPYAWRCFADQHFIDPCFSQTAHSKSVVCPFDPWAKNVRLVGLTRRLPRWVQHQQSPSAPWGIWTTNAKRCVISVSGAGLTIAGQLVRYECAGSGFLVGYANLSRPQWTIGYVPRYDLANPHLHPRPVGITDAWR